MGLKFCRISLCLRASLACSCLAGWHGSGVLASAAAYGGDAGLRSKEIMELSSPEAHECMDGARGDKPRGVYRAWREKNVLEHCHDRNNLCGRGEDWGVAEESEYEFFGGATCEEALGIILVG